MSSERDLRVSLASPEEKKKELELLLKESVQDRIKRIILII